MAINSSEQVYDYLKLTGLNYSEYHRIIPDIRTGGTAPHCDHRIIHAPGDCEFCDLYPQIQHARIALGVCFTNKLPEEMDEFSPVEVAWKPCPAMFARGDSVNAWHGNVAENAKSKNRRKEWLDGLNNIIERYTQGK